jgi:hypothetical protein
MDRREDMAADVVGSVRAEGLEPGELVLEILQHWADGLVETDQLGEAAKNLAAGDPLSFPLVEPEPLTAPS